MCVKTAVDTLAIIYEEKYKQRCKGARVGLGSLHLLSCEVLLLCAVSSCTAIDSNSRLLQLG